MLIVKRMFSSPFKVLFVLFSLPSHDERLMVHFELLCFKKSIKRSGNTSWKSQLDNLELFSDAFFNIQKLGTEKDVVIKG